MPDKSQMDRMEDMLKKLVENNARHDTDIAWLKKLLFVLGTGMMGMIYKVFGHD